jgi:protein-L-isoaspartate(D-aspartate) O-methyltransferase
VNTLKEPPSNDTCGVARFNMVEQQIRTWDVLDQRILDLLHQLPREDFVPPAYSGVAYADTAIPLGDGQFMLPPRIVARALQALEPQPLDRVLEVGTGSGYMTTALAVLSAYVVSVEISQALHTQASARLKARGIRNVSLVQGDGATGWEADSPYDVIVMTGSMPELNPAIQQQLKLGGRLFAIVGRSPAMEARLITRVGPNAWSDTTLFETVVAPLAGTEKPRAFKL